MTEEFAILFIKDRMEELGYGKSYFAPTPKHFSLYGGETRIIDAYNEYYFLIEADKVVSIISEFGMYDVNDDTINEQLYEHQGKLILTNKSKEIAHVKFIQVIPKHF